MIWTHRRLGSSSFPSRRSNQILCIFVTKKPLHSAHFAQPIRLAYTFEMIGIHHYVNIKGSHNYMLLGILCFVKINKSAMKVVIVCL